ncbi:MAG: hypothetical protein JRJ39_16275 [Deltaproteobacteria bacterium]|nr:hypothetical protein [Deltaproteobacteria bacterium]
MEKIKLSIFITVILSLMVFLGFLTGCCCKQVAGVPDAIELRVEFDTNKSFVRPAYHERIKEVADYMNSRGSDQYNQGLSQRRADSVRQ